MSRLSPGPLMRRLTIGSTWLTANAVIVGVCAFARNVVLGRSLGSEEFGLIVLATTVPTFVYQLLDVRSWQAGVFYITRFHQAGDSDRAGAVLRLLLIMDLMVAVASFVVIAIAAPFITGLFKTSVDLSGLMIINALTLLAVVPLGSTVAVLRVAGRFDWIAVQDSVSSALQLLSIVVCVALTSNRTAIIAVLTAAPFIQLIIAAVLATRAGRTLALTHILSARIRHLGREVRSILHFMIWTSTQATTKGIRQADDLLLGFFLAPSAVGQYRAAMTLARVAEYPVSPIFQTVYPEYAALEARKDGGVLSRLHRRVNKGVTIYAVVVCLGLVILGPMLMTSLFGVSFGGTETALRLLVLSVGIITINQFNSALLVACGKVRQLAVTTIAAVTLQFALFFALVPSIGINGAASAEVLYALTLGIPLFVLARGLVRARSGTPA